MKIRISSVFLLASILSLISCQNDSIKDEEAISPNSYSIGDTITFTGVVRLTDSKNTCSEGFNNYSLFADGQDIPFCVGKGNSRASECLPIEFNKEGQPIKVSGVILPILAQGRSDCQWIALQNIEPLK